MITRCAQENQDLVATGGPLRYGLMSTGDQWDWVLAITQENYQRVLLDARQTLECECHVPAGPELANLRLSSKAIDVDGHGVDVDGSGSESASGSDELDYKGVAAPTTKRGFLTDTFARFEGATLKEGKLSFPFHVGRTIENPVFAKGSKGKEAERRSSMKKAALFILVCVLPGCGSIAREADIFYLAVKPEAASVEIQIDRSFVERYKNRGTINATFTVDKAMGSPNPGFLDGDLHITGRAPEIVLPSVAEIANASSYKEALDLVHRAEGTGIPLKISGVWRLWAEHSGGATEKQGTPLPAYDAVNPKHVFEIHPVTRINTIGLLGSFRPVDGFKPGDARRTFGIYEKAFCTLKVEPRTVSIISPPGLYNDVEFIMEPTGERPLVVVDGRFVSATVRDKDGGLVVKRLRMVFVKGTAPDRAVTLLKPGELLRVCGIPRIDLAEISRRVRGSQASPALLTGGLPYEIIVLGVYPNEKPAR